MGLVKKEFKQITRLESQKIYASFLNSIEGNKRKV